MSARNGAAAEADDSGQTTSNLEILGELCWLYSHSETHADWPIGCLQQWLLPAILHKQLRLYRKDGRPHAFVSWAWMTKEVEEAYVMNTASLQPRDWVGGDRLWFIDLVAPFGGAAAVMRDLRNNVFPEEVARFLRMRKGDDTLRIFYAHGARAVARSKDPAANPPVVLRGKAN